MSTPMCQELFWSFHMPYPCEEGIIIIIVAVIVFSTFYRWESWDP